jgi:hypothetical protein
LPPGAAAEAIATAPTLVALALLVIATWSDGGFPMHSWAPLAVFVLVALAAARANRVRGPAAAVAALLWAYAGWTALSAVWADDPATALAGGAQNALYAGLASLPLLTLPSATWARRTAALVTAGFAALVGATFVACLVQGADAFLAGRLDMPVGYRNGSAALFAMAFWPLLVAAAHRRSHVLLRAGAFALAVVALGLALLTQSRGALIGFAVGGAVMLALGPDRLRRAWLAIFAVSLLAVASRSLVKPYDAFIATGATERGAVDSALGTLAMLGATGFGVALVLAVFDAGLRVSPAGERRLRSLGIGVLTALVLVAVTAVAATVGNPVELARDKVAEFKDLDAAAPGETRLGSTGGQRYDLWRIAWREFESAPIAGVGEGSYPTRYYAERATDRNLTTPHSLPMRVLAETGLVGVLLLGGALAAAAVALGRGWRSAAPADRRWSSAMIGAAAVLFSQSSVDWLWQIPGLTGLGMLCLGTGIAVVAIPRGEAPPRSRAWTAARAVPVLAVVLVAALFVSYTYVRSAREPDVTSTERLSQARTAQRLDPWALEPRYLEAGALEELGRVDEARQTLVDALEVAPADFSTMALLGDLETRAGRPAAARAWYRRALERNPRDVGLQELAR